MKTLQTQHGIALQYDERAERRGTENYGGWRYATVDVDRKQVILFANDMILDFRCGSHKEILKDYERAYGKVSKMTGGIVVDGVLHDTVTKTQKQSYLLNCVTGEQQVTKRGWKYG